MLASPLIQRGVLLLQQSRPELAEKELRRALGEAPDDYVAHAWLAVALGELDRKDEALREAVEAVRLAPDWDFAHHVHARRLVDSERLADAERAIVEAIRLNPADADHYAIRAMIGLQRSQWSDALDWTQRGLEHDPDNVDCLNFRSIALVKLGRKDQAAAAGAQTLRRQPDNPMSHAVQGWNYLEQSRPKEAMEHFREALRLDPENEYARQGLVEALKARYLVYRLMLRYFLWMAKLSGKAQWAVIIGIWFGGRVIRGIAQSNPALAPILWPLAGVLLGFCILTWIAEPLFNLSLMFNRYGWHALARHQRIGATIFGSLLAAAIAAGLVAWSGSWVPAIGVAALCAGLLLPTAGTFNVADRKARRKLGMFLGGVALLGVAGLACWLMDLPQWHVLGVLFLIASLGFGWLANIAVTRRPE